MRKDVFSQLVEKKGHWSLVRDLAKTIGKPEAYTRTLVNQLAEGITNQNLQRYLKIEARGESNKPGAYRVFPFPPKIKRR